MLLILALLIVLDKSLSFEFPKMFPGLWMGKPIYNILGPFANNYLFSISNPTSIYGDYLIENNLFYENNAIMGYQRFYVEGGKGPSGADSAGELWYCGSLSNYSNVVEQTGSGRLNDFFLVETTDLSATFCVNSSNSQTMDYVNPFKKGCMACDCGNWTLSYNPNSDTLTSMLQMSGGDNEDHSKHLYAELKRIGPARTVDDSYMPGHGSNFSCDFSENGRDSVPVDRSMSGCPLFKPLNSASNKLTSIKDESNTYHVKSVTEYAHCYMINKYTGFQVEWTLNDDAQSINLAISMPYTNDDEYIAIGFRPLSRAYNQKYWYVGTGHHFNFAMQGADIVTGSLNGGIRTYYADKYTGAPVLDNSLKVYDAKVTKNDNLNRTILSFSRPYISGYLLNTYNISASIVSGEADIIWAIGDIIVSQDTKELDYHYNLRGLRFIDWENPQIAMFDSWKC
eukprot:gene5553-7674_t